MSTVEPSGPWIEPMRRVKAVNPRNGRPSFRQLADLAGITTTTITNMVAGKTRPSAPTIQAVAKALNVTPEEVSSWLPRGGVVGEPWVPTSKAAQLTGSQREALDALIAAFVDAGEEDRDGEAEMTSLPANIHQLAARKTSRKLDHQD